MRASWGAGSRRVASWNSKKNTKMGASAVSTSSIYSGMASM